jgi:folate-binding protein YgfZ
MCTADVAALAAGQGCRAAMLTIKGKLLGDLIVLADADALVLDVDALAAPKIKDALEKHIIMDDVTVEDASASWSERGVHGEVPGWPSLARFGHAMQGVVRLVGVRELGMAGYRVLGAAADVAALVDPLGARVLDEDEAEVRRVEAGEPRYGRDMGEEHLPIESRLDEAISFTKGCYLGQEVIVRATQQGRINRKLVGLRLDGEGAAAAGTKLSHEKRPEAGTITSSVVSPRFGAIALGYVHRTVWEPGTRLVAHDARGERGATVVELPFAA